MIIKFFKGKGGEIMTFVNIYPFIKIGLKLISSTGKCIGVKKAAGEDVNLWDYIQCIAEGLNPLESDLVSAILDLEDKGKEES